VQVYTLPNGGFVWLGDQEALRPAFVEEIGASSVLFFTRSKRAVPAHAAWLGETSAATSSGGGDGTAAAGNDSSAQPPVHYLPICSPCVSDDLDESTRTWEELAASAAQFLLFLDQAKTRSMLCEASAEEGKSILICDPAGVNVAPAVFSMYLLLRTQAKVLDSLATITEARPAVELSLSLRRGLEMMTRNLDEKKLKRLQDRVRTSKSMSIAF
jgi:hypothetical protein